jgi:transposase
LKVEVYIHTPGKPWISGAVERMHGYWESVFEGDLSFLTVEDLDFLNRRAYDKCAYINAVRKHKRHGMSRFEAYSRITSDQLRNLPPVEVCKKIGRASCRERVY